MASFEEAGLCDQILTNCFGLVNNMRDNANAYKSAVTAGKPINGIANVMKSDSVQYLKRMQWITDLATRNLVLFDAALATRNLTRTAALALRTTLQNVANHTGAASLTSANEINTEADFILANVPNFERLW